MGRLRLKEAAGSGRWSCIQAFPAVEDGPGTDGDLQVENGFHSSLGAEFGGSRGPGTTSEVLGGGLMRLWDVGPRGGLGEASIGGKGALVSLVVRSGQWQRLAAVKFTRK